LELRKDALLAKLPAVTHFRPGRCLSAPFSLGTQDIVGALEENKCLSYAADGTLICGATDLSRILDASDPMHENSAVKTYKGVEHSNVFFGQQDEERSY
jgi:hypothetical protein